MRGNSEEVCLVNAQLDILKMKIIGTHMDLVYNNIPVTAQTIKSKLLGKAEKPRMLIPILEDHNNKIKKLIGIEYAAGTLERYKTSIKHTVDFLQWKYKVSDIDIKEINHAFVADYEFYLRTVRKCTDYIIWTVVKYRNYSCQL